MKWQSMIREYITTSNGKEVFRDSHKKLNGVLLLLFTILACISLVSCRTQYVALPSSHSTIEVAHRYDSISRDHVRYVFIEDGQTRISDTVTITNWKVRIDTIHTVDSIPYPVEVPVPGEMTQRQQFLYNSGLSAWLILALLALGGLIYITIKAIKR